MNQLRIELSADRQWQWKVFGHNGENTATSETYTRKDDAKRGFDDHAKVVLMVLAQDGKLKRFLEELNIDINLTAPAQIGDFVGHRPPERPPRKPSPLDDLGV